MLEKAPKYVRKDENIALSVRIQNSGDLKPIQDEYLYWDNIIINRHL